MGLLSSLGNSRRRKLEEFVAPQLQPGETIQASVPMLQTGNPVWQGIDMVGYFGMALTERNLYVISWKQSVPERPRELVATFPRAGLVVEEWKGRGALVLRSATGETVQLKVPGMHRKDADGLAAALSATPV